LENVIIKFTADTTGLEPAIKQLALMGKITDEDAKKIAQINAEQQKFNQTVAQTSNEFSDFQKSFNGVTEDIKKEVISNAAKQLGEFTNEAKKGGEQIKSLKAELRELKAQIASGTLGEKEMRAATMRAAELTDNLGDVQQKIKALSSDTKRIDTVVEAFKGLAAATSVVTGVMGLLGSENKELEKTLLKVQSAMAILQGVQELANLATGEGILKTQLLSTYQALAGKTATVMGYEISGATAMATGGISLLLAGLVYVVSTMSDTTEEAEKLKENTEREFDLKRSAYDQEEALLKQSLDNNLISQQEYNDKYKVLSEARVQIDLDEKQARMDAATAAADALGNLANIIGEQTAAGKALAIASATINTINSAVLAYQRGLEVPFIGTILAPINAAIAAAAGIANIKKIAAVKIPGQGSAGAAVPSVNTGAAPITPQAAAPTVTQLDNQTINRMGSATNRAYVLESDINNNQERLIRITRAARLG